MYEMDDTLSYPAAKSNVGPPPRKICLWIAFGIRLFHGPKQFSDLFSIVKVRFVSTRNVNPHQPTVFPTLIWKSMVKIPQFIDES